MLHSGASSKSVAYRPRLARRALNRLSLTLQGSMFATNLTRGLMSAVSLDFMCWRRTQLNIFWCVYLYARRCGSTDPLPHDETHEGSRRDNMQSISMSIGKCPSLFGTKALGSKPRFDSFFKAVFISGP